VIVMTAIGNSDNKLPQKLWAAFQLELRSTVLSADAQIFGDWHSYPDSIYQNACICFELDDDKVPEIKGELAALATIYGQDSIAWNELRQTEFLGSAAR
jgi:hypothetical protein